MDGVILPITQWRLGMRELNLSRNQQHDVTNVGQYVVSLVLEQ